MAWPACRAHPVGSTPKCSRKEDRHLLGHGTGSSQVVQRGGQSAAGLRGDRTLIAIEAGRDADAGEVAVRGRGLGVKAPGRREGEPIPRVRTDSGVKHEGGVHDTAADRPFPRVRVRVAPMRAASGGRFDATASQSEAGARMEPPRPIPRSAGQCRPRSRQPCHRRRRRPKRRSQALSRLLDEGVGLLPDPIRWASASLTRQKGCSWQTLLALDDTVRDLPVPTRQ